MRGARLPRPQRSASHPPCPRAAHETGGAGAGAAGALWARLEAAHAGLAPFRDAALDRWHRKALLAAGGGATRGGLRALDQAISTQVRRDEGTAALRTLARAGGAARPRAEPGWPAWAWPLAGGPAEASDGADWFAEHAALAAPPRASQFVTSHLIPGHAPPATRSALRGHGHAVMLAWRCTPVALRPHLGRGARERMRQGGARAPGGGADARPGARARALAAAARAGAAPAVPPGRLGAPAAGWSLGRCLTPFFQA